MDLFHQNQDPHIGELDIRQKYKKKAKREAPIAHGALSR
jgi:hypothetical protein